jgi:hypothetical protein
LRRNSGSRWLNPLGERKPPPPRPPVSGLGEEVEEEARGAASRARNSAARGAAPWGEELGSERGERCCAVNESRGYFGKFTGSLIFLNRWETSIKKIRREY